MAWIERNLGRASGDAAICALSGMIGKWAQAQGQSIWLWRRLTRRQARLIEYKGPASTSVP